MIRLLSHTYLLDIKKIEKELDSQWKRYESILANPNWKKMNEARAILYLIGHIYCETIAQEAIERRLHLLKKKVSLAEFLSLVDSHPKKIILHRKDPLFSKLEKYYILIKKFKNKFVGGKFYLDEEKFIKLYNKHNPDKKLKIDYKGRFGDK